MKCVIGAYGCSSGSDWRARPASAAEVHRCPDDLMPFNARDALMSTGSVTPGISEIFRSPLQTSASPGHLGFHPNARCGLKKSFGPPEVADLRSTPAAPQLCRPPGPLCAGGSAGRGGGLAGALAGALAGHAASDAAPPFHEAVDAGRGEEGRRFGGARARRWAPSRIAGARACYGGLTREGDHGRPFLSCAAEGERHITRRAVSASSRSPCGAR